MTAEKGVPMNLQGELKQNGFWTVPVRKDVTKLIAQTMGMWRIFCELPLSKKKLFTYDSRWSSGYEYKGKKTVTHDTKENFHFVHGDLQRIQEICMKADVLECFATFPADLLYALRGVVYNFGLDFEDEFQIKVVNALMGSFDSWILRTLYYKKPQTTGEVIAAPHPDKRAITLYLSESIQGIQYYSQNQEWLALPTAPDRIIIAPGLQLQYATQGKVTALYHQVVASSEACVIGRRSSVCFVGLVGVPEFNKEKGGRQQDMPVGYNYGMAHAEFSKFFE